MCPIGCRKLVKLLASFGFFGGQMLHGSLNVSLAMLNFLSLELCGWLLALCRWFLALCVWFQNSLAPTATTLLQVQGFFPFAMQNYFVFC